MKTESEKGLEWRCHMPERHSLKFNPIWYNRMNATMSSRSQYNLSAVKMITV